jgi:hypothetical protein
VKPVFDERKSRATISPDELPNRAFQLAYFLHRERNTALEIVTRALNKLQLAATAQGKRLYYRLTGRPDSRKARSKVSLGEPHLLQRLVYVESEQYEKLKEAAALAGHTNGAIPARQSDLVVFFIKHLVRITTRRNSFYVTLGLSRLLYNYTTAETMDLYNLVIQDPERVHDDYYYRSRKGLLLKELKERFGELVEVAKGVRGEQRWRPAADSSQHASLARECLHWFTPWETPCAVPETLDPLNDTIDQLSFKGRHPDEEHEVEVSRIHAALHPECFDRLAAANRLARPEDKLELPHFFLADSAGDDGDTSRMPPNLSADELVIINNLLAQEATRRKAASAGFLRVMVDGIQVAQIHTRTSAVARFEVNDQAEVVEVYSSDQKGALLLATHLLNFVGQETQNFSITTEGGQRISFTIDLLRDPEGSPAGAQVAVEVKEVAASAAVQRMWASISDFFQASSTGWWKPVAAFSALALLCAGAWWVWSSQSGRNEVVSVAPTPAPTAPVITPSPNQQTVEGPQRAASPAPKPSRNDATPAPVLAQRRSDTPQRDEAFVERSLLPNNTATTDPNEIATRGAWNRDTMGKPLNEVRRLHLQLAGGNISSDEFGSQLRERLASDQNLKLSDAEQADAALKISVSPASSRAGDSRVIVSVRGVNASGFGVWPAARRGSSWRYVGQPRFVADRIVTDLMADIRRVR